MLDLQCWCAMEALRRPLVVVEDHLYHIGQLLDLLHRHAPELLERLTVVCLDRRGPDTDAAVRGWVAKHPHVQIVADIELGPRDNSGRVQSLPAAASSSGPAYARTITELLAPRGLLVQDIQLETLHFLPADQWWESIYLANTVRGMYADRPPQCIFLSNKRGFHATFGKDLLEVGFDPRDVLHKDDLEEGLIPLLHRRLRDAFPLELHVAEQAAVEWLTSDPIELEQLSARLDLVVWDDRAAKLGLSGRCVQGRQMRLDLASDGQEAITWRELVEARVDGRAGISTREIGSRVGPEFSLPAEQSNAAARHIYALRKRLRSPDLLITADHQYALAEELSVGWVQPRPR
jgi:hypothetical protein